MAKAKHAIQFGPDAEINRVKIRKFKKEFKKSIIKGELKIDPRVPIP